MEIQPNGFSKADTTPRISVIVPVRNDPKRLGKCLESLARSTFRDFEVIVADDASTDETPSIAEPMGARLIRQPARSGPAAARNAAADVARGSILMFIDSDVCVHVDTLAVAAATFDDPAIDAVFGSYDLEPAEPNLLSQYKNLAHRFYHQNSHEQVGTFWSGCGAIRREVFNAFRFDAQQFTRPSIEDIELGARLNRAGKRIVINKALQAKHLKRWTLLGIGRSDLLDRAIPWTRVILRDKNLPGDLNLSAGQRIAALLTAFSAAIFLLACWFRPWLTLLPPIVVVLIEIADRLTSRYKIPPIVRICTGAAIFVTGAITIDYARWWAAGILLPLIGVVLINARFYRFFLAHCGWLVAATALPMQVAYYLYSIVGFGVGTLFHWYETMPRRLENPRDRARLYITLTALLYVIAWMLVLVRAEVKQTAASFIVSDAVGYYVYLPSLMLHHDWQFDNHLADVLNKEELADYRRQLHGNRWPTGVAMSISPAFFFAHGLSLPLYHWTGAAWLKPDGYSLLYQVCCVAWAMSIGTLGMIIADRLLVERLHMPGRLVAAAVLTTWLGTNYVWYFVREPLLAHMIGASWMIFAIYLIHRIELNSREGRLIWWHLPMLAFVTSMALVCRLSNAFMLPMFVYLFFVLAHRRLLGRSIRLVPLILPALMPLALQAIVFKILTGHVVHDTVQGLGYDAQERFYWTRPALLRTLFSSRHGLFFSTPSLLLAAWGLFWRGNKRRDPLLISLMLSALLLWYVNSAWYAWWFGPSVGNRGFVELAGLYAIGFALAFSWLSELRPRARRIVLWMLAFCILINYTMVAVKLFHLVGDNRSMIPWEDRILSGHWKRI